MKVAAIINPQSGGGKTIKVWRDHGEALNRKLGGMQILFSERPGHVVELAKEVALQDFDRLIVVGGDGTLHEVVNGLFDKGKPLFKSNFSIGIMNGGRGCDFVKTLKIPDDPRVMMRICESGKPKKIDIGCVTLSNSKELYYINSSTFGLGGQVAKSVQQGSALLPPTASYLAATVKSVLSATPRRLQLEIDGEKVFEGPAHNVFICNGRYSGGGMLWAPEASLDDGLFDVLLMRDLSRATLLTLAPRIYTGTLAKVQGVSFYKAKAVRVSSGDSVWLELDGETYQAHGADYRLLHQALNVLI